MPHGVAVVALMGLDALDTMDKTLLTAETAAGRGGSGGLVSTPAAAWWACYHQRSGARLAWSPASGAESVGSPYARREGVARLSSGGPANAPAPAGRRVTDGAGPLGLPTDPLGLLLTRGYRPAPVPGDFIELRCGRSVKASESLVSVRLGEDGIDDQVVVVASCLALVATVAGDEAKLWAACWAVDLLGGEIGLRHLFGVVHDEPCGGVVLPAGRRLG